MLYLKDPTYILFVSGQPNQSLLIITQRLFKQLLSLMFYLRQWNVRQVLGKNKREMNTADVGKILPPFLATYLSRLTTSPGGL
jgi:hypothetical protein